MENKERKMLITGFASPCTGYEEMQADLMNILEPCPRTCHLVRVVTERFLSLGIAKGDILIVDRKNAPSPKLPVFYSHDGEFLCGNTYDMKEGDEYFGTITFVVRKTPAYPLEAL